MKNLNISNIIPHVIAIVLFLILALGFFSPELDGKKIQQSDIIQWKGTAQEMIDHREEYGEEALWTNSLFAGMPAYLVSTVYPNPVVKIVDQAIPFGFKGGIRYMLTCMIGFYILMLVMKVDPWVAILGSAAFALSSYFIIIIQVGHNSKVRVIAYLPAILGGFLLLFRNHKYLLGAGITALFTSLALNANHPQMLYYLYLVLVVFGIVFLTHAVREKTVPKFFKAALFFILGTTLAVGTSASRLWTVYEYGKSSTRGQSELTINDETGDNKTSGLDRDYITSWSYGVSESFTLIVPNFNGGKSGAIGNEKTAMKKASARNKASIAQGVSAYWGDQSFVAGPTYAGAAIILLAILGLFFINGRMRWALLGGMLLCLFLSWGKNFPFLTNLFIDYFPGYNKFRAVSSILVLVILLLPFTAALGLHKIIHSKDHITSQIKTFYIAAGAVVSLLLLMLLVPSLFTSFFAEGEYDRLFGQLENAKYSSSQALSFLEDVEAVRKSIFTSDVLRSLGIVVISLLFIVLFLKNVIRKEILVAALVLVTVTDLWNVDRRYLNKDSFVSKRAAKNPFKATATDKEIMADPELGFRVFNVSSSLDSDARTSFFHKSLGGYNGAKMGRYQELVDFNLSSTRTPAVINMLNVKYFVQGRGAKMVKQVNPEALGSAWFVNSVETVENADEEMQKLKTFDPEEVALLDKRFKQTVSNLTPGKSETDHITMTEYIPNHLTYTSSSETENFAVFSEIFYQPGWKAYIDEKPTEHVRVNYVLRGMTIPAGDHKIEFKFEPSSFKTGNTIVMASSVLLVLLVLGGLFKEFKSKTAKTE